MTEYTITIISKGGHKFVYTVISRASEWFVSRSVLFHFNNIETFSIQGKLCQEKLFFLLQFPSYSVQFISVLKGVTTMNPKIIRGMEPHTRQRFHFATSSFSRIYGVNHVSSDMVDFCYEWALQDATAPLDCLNHVDRYFRQLWGTSHGGHQRHQLHQDFFATFQW